VAKNSGNRVLMDHALAKLARRPTIFYEANHVAGALGMVAAGLGIAAIPGLALSENTYPTVIGLTLTRPTINRTLGLIAKKGRSLQPAAAALYELLKNPLKSKH
jgi:DNA-binding transcriptional LysR family regulator